MKVLLVEPYVKYPVSLHNIGTSLGSVSLASYVKKYGPEVNFEFFSLELEMALNHEVNLEKELAKFKPDVVGIGSITCKFTNALEIARIAKKLGATVVMGGPFPTFNHVQIVKNGIADFVVRGEGEASFSELLAALGNSKLLKKVRGITYSKKGRVLQTEDRPLISLTQLPMPDYSIVNTTKFKDLGVAFCIETGRGCPYNCLFCELREMNKGIYRVKPISAIVQEIEWLIERYGVNDVRITEGTFTANRQRTRDLCKAIIESGVNAKFTCSTRPDALDEELVNLMYQAGINSMLIGVEAVDEEKLRHMRKGGAAKKPGWRELTLKIIKNASEIGFNIMPTFLLGWPGETFQTLRRLKQFIVRISQLENVIPYLAFVTPHPRTELWNKTEKIGLKIISHDLNKYTHLYPVAVPISLGKNALQILATVYNEIATETSTIKWNPLLEENDLKEKGIDPVIKSILSVEGSLTSGY